MHIKPDIKLTSLSIHSDIISKLEQLSEKTGLKRSKIIVYCLSKYAKDAKLALNLERLCQYQARCKEYRPYPVTLPQALYEKCFDLRKTQKLSLSFIFAIAFMKYLEELTKSPEKEVSLQISYSYKDNFYFGECFIENQKRFFVFCWEKPPE